MNMDRRGFLKGFAAAMVGAAAAAAPVRAVARLVPRGCEEFTGYFYFTPGPWPDNWHYMMRVANVECDELDPSTGEWLPGFSEPAHLACPNETSDA